MSSESSITNLLYILKGKGIKCIMYNVLANQNPCLPDKFCLTREIANLACILPLMFNKSTQNLTNLNGWACKSKHQDSDPDLFL